MAASKWGRTLLVANPLAHSGEGAEAADALDSALAQDRSLVSSLDVIHTHKPGDGAALSVRMARYDTVLVLGGDGVMHDVANGVMALPDEDRPRLGLVPFGTGNDSARTLGIPFEDVLGSLEALRGGTDRMLDLGKANDVYFVETLSFGYDAAIALDTSRRRQEGTRQRNAGLFVTSGMRIFSDNHEGWPYEVLFDGAEGLSGNDQVFAVQIGPTYGGGFKICPKASPYDGLLDICYNAITPKPATALVLFGLARGGLHVGAKTIRIRQTRRFTIWFESEPPAQADGERISGTTFEVSCVPEALRVIVPAS